MTTRSKFTTDSKFTVFSMVGVLGLSRSYKFAANLQKKKHKKKVCVYFVSNIRGWVREIVTNVSHIGK